MMTNLDQQERACDLVRKVISADVHILPETTDRVDVYVVMMTNLEWFCKTLRNWKAFVSTDLRDGRMYEVTYNGEKNETYVDVYLKESTIVFEY